MRSPARVGLFVLFRLYCSTGRRWCLCLFAGLALVFLQVVIIENSPHSEAKTKAANTKNAEPDLARLDERVSVVAAGRGNRTINLSDGHEVLTSYAGPDELQQALAQNQAQPLSLASADFDEDGVPDLVSGYEYEGRGIVTILRGNVDAIYPNSPEAQQRRAAGSFTNAPFLPPARVFAAPVAADFVGAGDFDSDGHWDVVVASRTARTLYLVSGDGRGGFASSREIALPGVVTAMTTGEMNRADGLTDLVIGVCSERGSQVLVFEGPEGALRADPEVLELKVAATSLALGQLDSEYTMDLAIATGNQLLVVHGRDRKLSLDESLRAGVPRALISGRMFDSQIRSVAIGHFTDGDGQSIAVLAGNGSVQLLSQGRAVKTRAPERNIGTWKRSLFSSGAWAQAELASVHVSSSSRDDLLVVDATNQQLHFLNKEADGTLGDTVSATSHLAASLDLASRPVAVLPMRLNGDALSDLTLLSGGKSAPVVLPTQATATFVVTNTNATGPGSLQFAILDANETPGADLISFNIPGPGPFTITPTNSLPTITDPVTIDGTTQPGFAGTPIIELTGATFFIDALTITAGNSVVRGLTINRFRFMVFLATNGGNIVEGNFIGTDVTGTTALQGSGPVTVDGGSFNNRIGGTTAAAGNLITGIVQYGVQITDLGTSGGNLVQGNRIGTDVTGSFALGGRNMTNVNGVLLARSVNDTIGGTLPGARNIISGNHIGIRIECIDCQPPSVGGGTIIQGNYIGLNAAGNAALKNQDEGIRIFPDSVNHLIGGTVAPARNVISSNGKAGIVIVQNFLNPQGNFDQIQGNYIGTDVSGSVDFGNGEDGVIMFGKNNTVGGMIAGARNVISGNALNGVLLQDSQSTGNFVQGNFIGTNAAGTAAIGNDLNGVATSAAPNNTIGGATPEARNIISANARHGVSIGIDTNSGATGVTVRNNYIGTDITGNNCLGNQRDGVFVNRGSVNHTILDNLITCNARNGVNIPNFATNDPGIRIEVTNNSIYANAALGIDLGDAGVTPNDPGDADIGANFLQNFPVLMSTTLPPAPIEDGTDKPNRPAVTVNINATLNSTPNTTFTVHWYFSTDSQCSNSQSASRPLAFGRIPGVTTGNDGNASFSFPFDFPTGSNSGVMNCTATDGNGNTSEFSACLPVTATPNNMQFNAAGYTVGEGGVSATVTVTRSGITTGASIVDFAASDGSATQNQDYVVTSGTLNFAAGETSKTFDVLIVNDAFVEANESINLTLSNAMGGTLGIQSTATITITDNDTVGSTSPAAKRYAAMLDGAQETPANNSPAKGTGFVLLNQSETSALVGLLFQNLGSAETAAHIHGAGAPGVMAPILFTLAPPIVNPVTNVQISPTSQQVADLKAELHYLNVHSNNFPNGEIRGQLLWNPTLEENFFVRQQYLDFLSRDGDPGGFGFWVNQVGSCGADAQCLHDRTITTSNAFFFEPEFQQTAGYVFRAYRAAFGNNQPFPNPDGSNATEANKLIDYSAFVADRARVVGGANLAAAQQAFANQFVLRSAFTTKYAAATTAAQFVDAILATIQNADAVDLTGQRQALIDQYNNAGGGNAGRAMVLYRLADDNPQNPINNQAFINAEYNRQFALTLYFGYLRRNPDIGGFLFWQSQINLAPVRDVPKQNALVCSFLTAAEYQLRFGPQAPRSNAECPQ